MPPSRLLLFEGMLRVLAEQGVAARDVDSVLEVGCSLGYLLRHLELNHFGRAQTLDGVDIDAYAIEVGQRQLEQERSRVRLLRGDSRELPQLLGDRTYDVTLCAGVLMYLAPADATAVVAEILGRTRQLAVFAGLARFVVARNEAIRGPVNLFRPEYGAIWLAQKLNDENFAMKLRMAQLGRFTGFEALNFADGKRNMLEIRDMVSAEFGPMDPAVLEEYFRMLEKVGVVTISPAQGTR